MPLVYKKVRIIMFWTVHSVELTTTIMAAVIFLYFTATLSLTMAQGLAIAPVIVPGDPDLITQCPSTSNARQLLTNQVGLLTAPILSIEQCGEGLWYQIVSVNMSKPDNQCPPSWVEENQGGVRACGRGTVDGGCVSATFSTGGRRYSKVCGRAIGYQYGHTDGFNVEQPGVTLEGTYVDGLSITYGQQPRQHIWTYASGAFEGQLGLHPSNCPCSSNPGIAAPAYLGNNWYCESGNPTADTPFVLLPDDPLWDGQDCEGTCCPGPSGMSPPWFSVELSGTTSEDIEARVCGTEHSDNAEDDFIAVFEIYVQ